MKIRLSDHLINFFFSKRGTALSLFLCLLVLTVFLVQMYGRANRESGYDFTSYLLSSQVFLDGRSPYQTGSPFRYIYPLFLCVILVPLSMMPYWLSTLLWFLGNSSALYFVGVILIRYYSPALTRTDIIAVFIVPFLVLLDVIQNNLLNGQVNFIVLLLCTLFLRYYLLSRRFTASLFLSVAIAIKLTPLLLLVYLLCRRDFLILGLVFFMSLTLSFVVPYTIGGAATFDYYSEYLNSFLMNQLSLSGQTPQVFAFSLTSIIGFFIPSIPKLFAFILAGVLALAPIALIQFLSHGEQSTERETLVFSLYVLSILLVSPMSETHHLINLFPALCVVVLAMLEHSERHFKIGALVLALVLGSLILGKFYPPVNLVAISTLYSSMLWLIWRSRMAGMSHGALKLAGGAGGSGPKRR